ncbi:MAG: hypothetical protein AAFQ89_06815, partial [Cyanobacteria bacterium J06626_18]
MAKKTSKPGTGATQTLENKGQPELSRKEQRKQERQRAKARQEVIQFCSGVIVLSIFAGVVFSLIAEPKLGIGLGGAIAALLLSFKFPRYALYGFIFYLPFSGTVTYGVGGGSAILQLAKDAIFFPALIGVILFCRKFKQPLILPQAIKIPLLMFVTFLAAVLLLVNGSQQL